LMKGFWQLTLTQVRLYVRNRQALFWSFFFPVFMMMLLGGVLGDGNGFSLSLTVADDDQSRESRSFLAELSELEGIEVRQVDRAGGMTALEQGDADMLLVIPSGFGEKVEHGTGVSMKLYHDKENPQVAEIGKTLVHQFIDRWNKQLTEFTPLISVEDVSVQSVDISYTDFLVPGILALLIMNNSLNGVTATISSWRERGILRRLQGTPLRSATFVASQIAARFLFNSAQIVLVLLVALFVFGVRNNGSWLLLMAYVILGTFTFMAIGFIIASVAKNPESASPLAGLLSFFMMFLGGIFFPIRDLPVWLAPLIHVLPISYLAEALRGIMNASAGWTDLWREGLVLLGWLIGSFVVSAWTFKWEEERD